jgi:hypothetical protein
MGNQAFDDGPGGGPHRYESDWFECPGGTHRFAAFARWIYTHRDDHPSYYDVYFVARNEARYSPLRFLDVVGTHDWINPLGSLTAFWQRHDGLTGLVIDPNEPRWDFRTIRRINVNHGIKYIVGSVGPTPVGAEDLLLWRELKYLVFGSDLPRMEMVGVAVRGTSRWYARVRVNGNHALASESYKVWVALSDDRDFRRCTAPVVSASGTPCADGLWGDDNKDQEDEFIAITPLGVTPNGEFRDLRFAPPAELSAFPTPPIVAVIVELKIDGANPRTIVDDLYLHTEVTFTRADQYPEYRCP